MPFYITEPYTCPYLPGKTAKTQVWLPSQGYDTQSAMQSAHVSAQGYGHLLRAGFRRSGDQIYRPQCPNCQACVPVRIGVDCFVPNRNQQRAWRRYHEQLQAEIGSASIEVNASASQVQEDYHLYQSYQKARHPQSSMARDDLAAYQDFMTTSSVDSCVVRFKNDSPNGVSTLCMVSLIDIVDDGLSAVYTFYDPSPGQSYGTFGILWQIAYTRQLGLPFVYLGYWIADNPQMAYKAHFTPHEVYTEGRWEQVIRPTQAPKRN
jgi:arginyl-tRNA--protein-N-Asp/Glu arginylyltransferase